MEKYRIILDEFYLKALIQAGIAQGVFRRDDFSPTLRSKARSYTRFVERLYCSVP